MRTFRLYNKKYHDENELLYAEKTITLKENTVTCFVGCNGSGKSTLITQITRDGKDCLAKDSWDVTKNFQLDGKLRGLFDKNNVQENFDSLFFVCDKDTQLGNSERDYVFHHFSTDSCSTGEGNLYNYKELFGAIEKSLPDIKGKTFYLFFDDFDVGTSIDILRDYIAAVRYFEKKLKENNITYYIVLTANAYELAKNFTCIDCRDFNEITFKDYDDYCNFIIESRKYKDNRYAKMAVLAEKTRKKREEEAARKAKDAKDSPKNRVMRYFSPLERD